MKNGRENMSKIQRNKITVYFKFIVITLLVSMVLFGAIIFYNISRLSSNEGEQVVYSNELYTLRGKPTALQKSLFKELTEHVKSGDELAIVESVVRNFAADYYTWTNKQGPFDVGGTEYIFYKENTNFRQNARRYHYTFMYPFIESGLTFADLVEVESVTTNGAAYAAPFDHYGETYTTFYCEISWSYKVNDKLDLSIFPTSAAFTIIKTSDNRYEIVRFY